MRHIKEIMIVAVCLMVLSFCVCTGFGIYFMYREGVQEYEDLRTYVKETDEDDHTEGTDGSDGKQTVVDFRALKKINPDIVAWIRIPDTSIDYPVVQGNDDSYYLTHTFKKAEHVAGAIFLDSDNNADFSDDKNIIYGHNMKDGSMFRGLRNFLDDEFLKEHQILYLYLPDGLCRFGTKQEKDGAGGGVSGTVGDAVQCTVCLCGRLQHGEVCILHDLRRFYRQHARLFPLQPGR